jgi:hypothetical protein
METLGEIRAGMTDAERATPATRGDLLKIMEVVASANKALKRRIEKIEDKGVKYLGTWQRSADYERGDLATHKGSMWHAIASTRDEPGTSSAWQLAVKAGRDGR